MKFKKIIIWLIVVIVILVGGNYSIRKYLHFSSTVNIPVFISGVKSNMVSLFSFSTITWILPFETSPSNLKVY